MQSFVKVEKILERAVILGESYLSDGKIQYSELSQRNEEQMLYLIKEAAIQEGIDEELFILKGGHSFPDIWIDGTKIGIELKGARVGKIFNGNSIYGSTLIPDLQKIYLFYWIDADKVFGWRDYFECVDTPIVTHSPRFRVNPYLPPGKSMFGENRGQVGLVEEVIFNKDGIQTDKILAWMSEKAKAAGERAWWIVEENTDNTGLKIGVKSLEGMEEKRIKIAMEGFLLFPEMFSNSPDKFYSFIAWAISVYSLVLDRDFYSAGGKEEIFVGGKKYLVSQIFYRFLDYLNIEDDKIGAPFKFPSIVLKKTDFSKKVQTLNTEEEFFNIYLKNLKAHDKFHLYESGSKSALSSECKRDFWLIAEQRLIDSLRRVFTFNSK